MKTYLYRTIFNTTRGDKLIIVISISIVFAFYVFFWQATSTSGQFVHVINGQNEMQKISLFQNQKIKLKGSLGDSMIQIQGGRVRFLDSVCSNKLCVHQGWADLSGEIIACLPNQISISIAGLKSRFDSVNF